MRDIDLMALLLGPWPRQIARFVFESSDLRSVLLFYSHVVAFGMEQAVADALGTGA